MAELANILGRPAILGDAIPQPAGSASAGVAANASRVDHVHARRFGIAVSNQNAAYTFALSNRDGAVVKTDTAAYSWTVPPNASVPFAVGDAINLVNDSLMVGDVTITPDAGVTLVHGTSSGAFTLVPGATRLLHQLAANRWRIC